MILIYCCHALFSVSPASGPLHRQSFKLGPVSDWHLASQLGQMCNAVYKGWWLNQRYEVTFVLFLRRYCQPS
jgi:hypothetical protein